MMTEEEVPDEIEHVKQSSIQASDGDIKPVEHLPELMEECSFEDFMKLGSRSDKKVHEDKVVEPKCGMIFDTADEAYTFYNGYARKIGFSVRKLRTNKSRADRNKILRQVLVCACEGTYQKIRTPKKRRENRRFECKALFEFKLIGDKYHVIQFILEHTHDLVPPQSAHYLRSHRRIESSQVGLINKMHSSGFKQSDIYSYMSNEAGGPQYLNFIPSDCYNLLQRKRVEFLKKGDSQCLLEYFKQKQHENKHFFYSFRTTEENEVFRDLQYEHLPPRYYLKRWTRTIVDEDVFDLHGDLIPNDNDPSLTIRYSALSQISQRIVSKSSKFPDVSALTEVGLLELDAKVDSWISSRCANENVASNPQTNSTLNLDDEAPLRDPTKRKRRQGNKRKRGALEGKQPKKKTSCKRMGKGKGSTTEGVIEASQPSQEVEEVENTQENITLNVRIFILYLNSIPLVGNTVWLTAQGYQQDATSVSHATKCTQSTSY
ncbi:hypothetical protein Vadar_012599 [Vaccinium darrowii]|uniref:Uncharacterized protein n=1 Tax=Vaccinium darrowii TaxID=229202 RepID=A0ACB7Y098_9ERIC|nr:hypothetical protein Vadar_012599 [Vaccinium darrowii]